MYNILITSRDIIFIKTILSQLSKNIDSIKITNIATSEFETISDIISGNIDIAIFDNKEKIFNIENILDEISNYFLFNYPIVINIDSNSIEIKKNRKSQFISTYDEKNYNINNIIAKIVLQKDKKKNKKNYKKFIYNELMKLGFNPSHRGTRYLIDSILLIKFSMNEDCISKLEKNVYLNIAKKYKTNASNVKSNILKAINYGYITSDYNIVSKYFNICDNYKITPKLIISTIINKI